MKTRWFLMRLIGVVAVAVLIVAFLGSATTVGAAPALLRSDPAANSVVAALPKQLSLTFAGPVLATGSVTVFGTDHKPAATADLRVDPDAADRLVADLPQLPKGVYAVVWKVGDDGGAFGFQLDPSQGSPGVVVQPAPVTVLSPMSRVVTKWLAFTSTMTFIGTLSLLFLVSRRVIGRLPVGSEKREQLTALTDRRLLAIAGLALLVFIPGTLGQLVYEAGAAAKLTFTKSFDISVIVNYLRHVPAGHLWAMRLAVTGATMAIFLPFAAATLSSRRPHRSGLTTAVAALGLLGASTELLLRTTPATLFHTPSGALPRAVFTFVLDWGHLLGAAVWIGGLIGLLLLALVLRLPSEDRSGFWSAAVRRFSLVATICVGSQILTGLWTAWIHVGAPDLLFTTLYGRALLIKLCLVAALMAFGAFHQLWLLPRLEAAHAAGNGNESHITSLFGHFRRVIAIEVALGLVILFIVPMLSGSARNQAFQAKAWSLKQTAFAGAMPVVLKPSAEQPGLTHYDITLPKNVDRVTIGFASKDLGVPETDVVATAEGAGHYRATGIYTPMVGNWQVTASVLQGKEVSTAVFGLPIQAKPIASKSPTPQVVASTWEYGIAELVAVIAAVVLALTVSRWVSAQFLRGRSASPYGEEGSP